MGEDGDGTEGQRQKDGGEESQGVSWSFAIVLKCFMEKDHPTQCW